MSSTTKMQKVCSALKIGEKAIVCHFTNDKIASKLVTMGLLPGSTIELIREAPFGGAYYLRVDGQNFALRTNEAACIIVE